MAIKSLIRYPPSLARHIGGPNARLLQSDIAQHGYQTERPPMVISCEICPPHPPHKRHWHSTLQGSFLSVLGRVQLLSAWHNIYFIGSTGTANRAFCQTTFWGESLQTVLVFIRLGGEGVDGGLFFILSSLEQERKLKTNILNKTEEKTACRLPVKAFNCVNTSYELLSRYSQWGDEMVEIE